MNGDVTFGALLRMIDMETFTAKCPSEVPLPAAAVVDESARIYSANAPFRSVLQHSASVHVEENTLRLRNAIADRSFRRNLSIAIEEHARREFVIADAATGGELHLAFVPLAARRLLLTVFGIANVAAVN